MAANKDSVGYEGHIKALKKAPKIQEAQSITLTQPSTIAKVPSSI